MSENKNILVIEDNRDIQESIKSALEFEGYTVFTADNGKIAIHLLDKIPRPCMILLDLMMPIMNGWEFVEEINKDQTCKGIPVIVVSAFGDKQDTPNTEGFIKKPIDLDALLETVSSHCQ